ncbi:MAG: hypothetical protein L0Y44_08945 [Phycisphaerales bacterium]|nr:hypothetical protein [Phycisphaerales bacterium]
MALQDLTSGTFLPAFITSVAFARREGGQAKDAILPPLLSANPLVAALLTRALVRRKQPAVAQLPPTVAAATTLVPGNQPATAPPPPNLAAASTTAQPTTTGQPPFFSDRVEAANAKILAVLKKAEQQDRVTDAALQQLDSNVGKAAEAHATMLTMISNARDLAKSLAADDELKGLPVMNQKGIDAFLAKIESDTSDEIGEAEGKLSELKATIVGNGVPNPH